MVKGEENKKIDKQVINTFKKFCLLVIKLFLI